MSIRQFMQKLDGERTKWEAMDAPLTDYEYSETEGSPPRRTDLLNRLRAAQAARRFARRAPTLLPNQLTRKQKKNRRSTGRQAGRIERAKELAEGGLKGVAKKRALESTKVTLKLPLNMGTCPSATAPGWVGRPLPVPKYKLPRTVLTMETLRSRYNVARFDWDGM